jgi:biotin-dependent carboxylase-like uncharacterized protein
MEVLKVLESGFGMAFQDAGRKGWRRFGVPPSGVMDEHAAGWANRLLQNPPGAVVLELSLQGAKLEAIQDVWIAVTGANAGCNIPMWETFLLGAGKLVQFPRNRTGVWSYLAVEGGFKARRWFGSASVYARGGLGRACQAGDTLHREPAAYSGSKEGIARRLVSLSERRDYDSPPYFRLWRGPQWDLFSEEDRSLLFAQEYAISSHSDRVGYRLESAPLKVPPLEMISEPVQTGSIQVPPDGCPIVTMRDGPTLGGYPKIGLLCPEEISWLAQCRPGQLIRFQKAEPVQ